MQATTIYLTPELQHKVRRVAETTGKHKAQVIRDALSRGLTLLGRSTSRSPKTLVELTQLAKEEKWSGPTDLAAKHDSYFVKASGRNSSTYDSPR